MSSIRFASCGSIPLCTTPSFTPLLHQWGKVLGIWIHHLCWRKSKGTMPIPSLAHCPSSPTPFSPTYFQTTTFSIIGSAVEPSLHEGIEGSKYFSSPFSTFSPSTLNKWPSLMKLWLVLRFHFVLLHAHGRGQSLPWRVDQLNSKEWAWKRIYILHLTIGHGPPQRSNMSMEATAGLLVSDVHLSLSTEGKRWPLFKEKSSPIIVTWNSSAKRHFLKLGQVRRTKGNWCTQ